MGDLQGLANSVFNRANSPSIHFMALLAPRDLPVPFLTVPFLTVPFPTDHRLDGLPKYDLCLCN